MHVVATAGHVDHGKSTLVRALTGMEPDRLSEERRRGLTIDLGFAWTTLPSGQTVAFVDVPGHQRFISNMLAGVGPVPAVLFVVAADAGWSAQSAEHLEALDALQVRHGVLAITRADLGDAALAEAEARDHLAGTTFEGVEAVAISSVTGVGIDALRHALGRMVATLPSQSHGRTRLWIDRVFTVHGSGTVVTGTLSAGSLDAGEQLQLHPTGEIVHVRSMQSLSAEITHADAVSRVAVNLRGVPRARVHRGDTLTRPGDWRGVTTLDVRLSRTGRLPEQMIFHIGSAAVSTRVRALGADTARLTLRRPVATVLGERAVLRDQGSRRMVAALVLDPAPPSFERRGAARRRAAQLDEMHGMPDPAGEVRRRGAVRQDELMLIGAIDGPIAAPDGAVAAADWLIALDRWRQWSKHLPVVVDEWARSRPSAPGMTPAVIADALKLPDPALVEPLLAAAPELVFDSDGVHSRDRRATLTARAASAVERLRAQLAADPFNALAIPELESVGLTERELTIAVAERRLLRISKGLYLLPETVDAAVCRLSAFEEPFTLSQARQALQTTRRTAVPLLEFLDRCRRTRRVDDQHREVIRR